jgi:anaerobic magnesium-protoporphyrin IX monomethyl ester cyclase
MARILLVDPCGWQGGVSSDNVFPNIGVAYLTASLHAAGHEVHVADMNNEVMSNLDIVDIMLSRGIRIVGISVKTATLSSARSLGSLLKRQLDCVVIVGGAHASMAGTDLAQEDWVDHMFVGEAEENLPRFCCELDGLDAPPPLAGIQQPMGVPVTPLFVADLDKLPFPDYSLFPERTKHSVRQNYPLVTSRGCVFDCIYCSVPNISGNKFRKRSPENVIAELEWALANYAIEEFCIIDDAFNLDMARSKQFCRLLLDHQVRLRWSCPNGLRADRVDQELAELMFRSGCYSVMLGVESGDPEVFAGICKGESLDQVSKGIRIFQNAGIQVGGYFLIGLPGDCIKSQLRSVEFAKQHGIIAHFNMLIPYPGTALWDWVRKHGRMLRNIEQGLHFADSGGKVLPVFETHDFSESERNRAYELVHTRVARFEMLMPNSLNGWRRTLAILVLVLKYDRERLFATLKRGITKTMQATKKT